MMVRVPSRVHGFAGLGNGDEAGDVGDSSGSTYQTVSTSTGDYQLLSDGSILDPSGTLYSSMNALPTSEMTALQNALETPISTSVNTTPIGGTYSNLSNLASGSVQPTQAQLQQAIQGGTATGLTAAQISNLIAQAANAGVKILNATQSPYLIPGTQLVYNPATGALTSGIANQLTTPFGTLTGSTSSVLMLGGFAIVGVLVLAMVMRRN